MLNPCCCMTPRIGAFIFAIIDLVVSLVNGFYLINATGGRYQYWVEFGLAVLMIILAVLLLVGAVQNSIDKLKLWLILWIVLLLCVFIFQVFNMYSHSHAANDTFHQYRIGSNLLGFIIFLYEIWVVYAFIHELRYGPAGLTYCPAQVV